MLTNTLIQLLKRQNPGKNLKTEEDNILFILFWWYGSYIKCIIYIFSKFLKLKKHWNDSSSEFAHRNPESSFKSIFYDDPN